MSDFSDAYAEVSRAVRPDDDPTLTHGDGDEPDEAMELDKIILESARGKVWSAGLVVKYGDVILPTVGNGRKYKVITPGTLGGTEPPSWPDYDFGRVESGTVTLEEAGFFSGNVYDVRGAIYEALEAKIAKSAEYQGDEERRIHQNLVERQKRYRPVGIA